MKDKVGVALAVAVMAGIGLLISACGASAPEATDISGEFKVTQVAVNGKQVTCVTWSDYRKGGVSCDWANAK